MKLLTHTGTTSFAELQVQKPLKAIIISSDKALTGNEKITISKVSSDNSANEDSMMKIPLKAVVQLSTAIAGFYRNKTAGYRCTIPIGTMGAPKLGNDGYYAISIEGMDETAVTVIRGLEYPTLTDEMVKWDRKNVNASSEGLASIKLAVAEYDVLVLPKTNLDIIKLSYKNGATVEYDKEVLEAIADQTNDIVEIAETEISYGSKDYFILQIADVTQVEVVTDGTQYSFYAVKL